MRRATFTPADIAVLTGMGPYSARQMFEDREFFDGTPGPFRRLPGFRVLTPATPVLRYLEIDRETAEAILNERQAA